MRFVSLLLLLLLIGGIAGCATKNERLVDAVNKGDKAGALALLDSGVDVEDVGRSVSPLCAAAEKGDEELVKLIITKGGSVRGSSRGGSPIFVAKNKAVAQLLVENGADVNSVNSYGITPLMYASGADFELVGFYIERGADLNYINAEGVGAIHVAAHKSKYDVVKLLVDSGVDVNRQLGQSGSDTPLIYSVKSTRFCNVYDECFDQPWSGNMEKTKVDQLKIIKLFLDKGADASLVGRGGRTAKYWAINYGRSDLVALLTEAERVGPIPQPDPVFDDLLTKGRLPAIKSYLDGKPKLIRFVKDDVMRLRLTGPAGLRVDDLIGLIQAKQKDSLIIAQMQAKGAAYKKFDPAEVATLQKMGVTDDVIAAMISLTTEQDKSQGARASAGTVPSSSQSLAQSQSSEEEKSEDCVQLALALKACSRTGGLVPFGGSVLVDSCKSTARSSYHCSVPIERLMR